MIDIKHSIIQILIMAVVTAILRFLPFLLFPDGKKRPAFISYLGTVLPYAIIGMLVVYCFKDVSFVQADSFLPAIIAGVTVILLHIFKRNTLLSVFGGTACYMLLIKFVF